MTEDEAIRIVDKLRHQLAEYFDATQIHISWVDSYGQTGIVHRGSGNYYARVGMAEDFLNKEQAEVVADEIKKTTEES